MRVVLILVGLLLLLGAARADYLACTYREEYDTLRASRSNVLDAIARDEYHIDNRLKVVEFLTTQLEALDAKIKAENAKGNTCEDAEKPPPPPAEDKACGEVYVVFDASS